MYPRCPPKIVTERGHLLRITKDKISAKYLSALAIENPAMMEDERQTAKFRIAVEIIAHNHVVNFFFWYHGSAGSASLYARTCVMTTLHIYEDMPPDDAVLLCECS